MNVSFAHICLCLFKLFIGHLEFLLLAKLENYCKLTFLADYHVYEFLT